MMETLISVLFSYFSPWSSSSNDFDDDAEGTDGGHVFLRKTLFIISRSFIQSLSASSPLSGRRLFESSLLFFLLILVFLVFSHFSCWWSSLMSEENEIVAVIQP